MDQTQLLKGVLDLVVLAALDRDDGYGYDIDMVEQRIVYALYNGIKWARSGYQN